MLFLKIIPFYHVGNNFDTEGFIDCMTVFLHVLICFYGIPFLIVFALFIICVLFMLYVVDGYAIPCDVYRLTRQRLSHHEAMCIASRSVFPTTLSS